MDMDQLLPPLIFGIWVILLGILIYINNRALRRAVLDRIAVYGGQHEWREASILEYPRLKQNFYDECQSALEGCGFKHLGDIEDRTLAATKDNPWSFRRVMVSPDKKAVAEFWQINYSPWKQLFHMLGKGLGDARFIRIFSESVDGRVFSVIRAPKKMRGREPSRFEIHYVESKMSADELWARFAGDYSEYVREHPDFEPRPLRFIDEVIASEQRQQEVRVAMRREVGLVTREDLLQEGMPEKSVESYLRGFNRQLRKLGGWPRS